MKNRLHFYILILLLVPVITCSQVPGYQGKKFSFGYDCFFAPALFNPNANGNKGLGSFNLRESIGIDYVFARKISLGMTYHYYKSNFYLCSDFLYSLFSSYYDKRSGPIGKINGQAYSFYFKFYRDPYIAPLGKYIKVEFIHQYYKLEDIKLDELADIANDPGYLQLKIESKYTVSGLGIIFGSQRIIFDRIILNSGLQLGLLFRGLRGTVLFETGNVEVNQDNYFDYVTRSRIFSQYMINFNLGIGFLVI